MSCRVLTTLPFFFLLACPTGDSPMNDAGPDAVDSSSPSDSGGTVDVGNDAGPDTGRGCFVGTSEGVIGDACNCQMDCTPGMTCALEGGAGGPYGSCTLPCTDDGGECGPEGACTFNDTGAPQSCRRACTEHSQCREGWGCFYGKCTDLCTEDSHCLSGSCNVYQGSCIAPPVGDKGILEACTLDEECRSGVCFGAIGCVTFCEPGSDTCPEDAACLGAIDPDDVINVGICMTRCETSATCPSHLECITAAGERVCYLRG